MKGWISTTSFGQMNVHFNWSPIDSIVAGRLGRGPEISQGKATKGKLDDRSIHAC
jgi:hypothetical protein